MALENSVASRGAASELRTTVIRAALAGGLALVLLLLAFWGWMATGDRTLEIPGASLVIPGADLQLAEGRGAAEGRGIRLQGPGPQGRTILVTGIPDDAPDLRRLTDLQIPVAGTNGLPEGVLMWINAADSGTEHAARIDLGAGLELADLAGWDGRPAMLGLVLQGPGVEGLHIDRLEFLGEEPGVAAALRAVLAAWVEPVAFSNSTPHVVRPGSRDAPFRPTSVAVAWVLLAASMFALMNWRQGRRRMTGGVVLVLLAAWLVLDLRWQADVLHEHHRTFTSYAGVPDADRVPADYGGQDLGVLVAAAKEQLEPDARVFTISANDGLSRYVRYRLLPLGGFFQAELTRDTLRYARPGDALILLVPHDVSPLRLRRGLSSTAQARFPWHAELAAWQGADTTMADTAAGPRLQYQGEGPGRLRVPVPFTLPSAFYRIVVDLEVPGATRGVRLRVWRTGGGRAGGDRELVAERVVPAWDLSAGAQEVALGFGLPARGDIEVDIGGIPAGTRLGALRLEYPEDVEDWVAVTLDGRPPVRAARLLKQHEGDLLFELQ